MNSPARLDMVSRFRTADNLIVSVRRRDRGRALRQTMTSREVSIKQLAARTAELDPAGRGVNWRTIGFLVSEWRSGRETTTYRNAALIAAALDVPLALLFDVTTTRAFNALPTSAQGRNSEETA